MHTSSDRAYISIMHTQGICSHTYVHISMHTGLSHLHSNRNKRLWIGEHQRPSPGLMVSRNLAFRMGRWDQESPSPAVTLQPTWGRRGSLSGSSGLHSWGQSGGPRYSGYPEGIVHASRALCVSQPIGGLEMNSHTNHCQQVESNSFRG